MSRVPTLWNLRTGPIERLGDCSDVPETRRGILQKHKLKLKENDKATFQSSAEEWVLPDASTKEPEEREFVVDSGASMHMVSKKDLNSAELETMRTSKSPTTVMTANDEVRTTEGAPVCVKQLDLFVKVMLLEETPAVLSLGTLCEDYQSTYHWTSGQKPHLIRNDKKNDCNTSNFCGSWFVSEFFLDCTFTYFSIIFITGFRIWCQQIHQNPVPERSGSTSEEPRETRSMNPQKPKTKIKMGSAKKYKRDISHELPATEPWGNPEQESQDTSKSSHVLPMEPRAKVEPGSGTHSVFSHFPKDPNCDICLKAKKQGLLAEDVLVQVVPRAEHFGDLITADHKVLSEESESRNNHRYAVVIQDLASQWTQSFPCKTETSQETQKSLMKFLEPTRKPKVIYILTIPWILASLVKNYPGIIVHQHQTDHKHMELPREQCGELKKGHLRCCCNQVRVTKGGGDSMECYCHLRSIQDFLSDGKTPYEGRFGMPFNRHQWHRSEQWSKVTLFLRKPNLDCISLEQKSCQVYFSVMHHARRESGKETTWSQTLKNWRRWTHLNSTPESSMQKKC